MRCFKCCRLINENEPVVSGLHEACFLEWFKLEKPAIFTDIAAKNASTGNDPAFEMNGSFFHGKFKKYSAVLNGKCYIFKVQEKDFPELPATEYLCNQIARHLGLFIPDFFLIRFEDTETFVSQNFMPKYPTSNMIHLYHFIKSAEEYTCESLLRVIESKTRRLEDMERFIEVTLFDALIGNHDRHGRNLALIESLKGIQLAPFYDNPSYLGIEMHNLLAAQHEPRGQIYTAETKEPKMSDYVKEWNRLGHANMIDKFRQKIKIEEIMSLIDNSFISEKRKASLKTLINNRYQELIL
jgi:hypothetical protein